MGITIFKHSTCLTIDVDTLWGTRRGKHTLAPLIVTQRQETRGTYLLIVLIRKNQQREGSHSGVWEISEEVRGALPFPLNSKARSLC